MKIAGHTFDLAFQVGDKTGEKLARGEPHAEWQNQIYDKYVTPGSVVLDIGAHIGRTAVLFAKMGARVYAFEPEQQARDLLEYNVKANNVDVTVLDYALSDKAGSSFIEVETDLSRSRLSFWGEKIETQRFDDLPVSHSKIDFIKIDCEGSEYQVLKGMKRTLQSKPPLMIWVIPRLYYKGLWGMYKKWRLIKYLRSFGYTLKVLVHDGSISTLDDSFINRKKSCDLLAW